MAYVLHGGPRDRQLVDDLPRGYRHVAGPAPVSPFAPIDGIPIDAAVWEGGAHLRSVDRDPEDRPRLRAL